MHQAHEPITIGSHADPGPYDSRDQADFTLDAVAFDAFQALLDQPPAPTAGLRRTLRARPPWNTTADHSE
ncbi:DUF1778 domain-containing protein [Sphaerotilus microaerophilus]|jgi:hypothetical protein|uniref:DUF1778 domain-containing protein n=1 Tax=Sphaerotilus microaerophilus TaxID=2914710 RepID=A0ABM7YSX0_9BURK|nr:DUF1778 domain-containing protein [Sphaerotilus sp. FB-5]BDI07743.1 hypothetical protein CATMQ487_47130 [Sphaerotilus sp. FB-5]